MSLKTIFQTFILLVIILIIGSVYIKYFDTKENVVNELRLLNENNEERFTKDSLTIVVAIITKKFGIWTGDGVG